MGLVNKIKSGLTKVQSWESMSIPPAPPPFESFFLAALSESGQASVPFFNEAAHLVSPYTGFVRFMKIYDFSAGYPGTIKEDAEFAYIENGKILFAQTDRSRPDIDLEQFTLSWRDTNFRVEEQYEGMLIDKIQTSLTGRKRVAEFVYESLGVRAEVTQDHKGNIKIRLDDYNEQRRKSGYGPYGVIEVEFDQTVPIDSRAEKRKLLHADHLDYLSFAIAKDLFDSAISPPDYGSIQEKMNVNPNLFSDITTVLALFKDSIVHPRSNVYFGFADGRFSDSYSPTERSIVENIHFAQAVAIAFPQLTKFNK